MSEVDELAGKLRSEGDRLAAFFASLSGPQWDQPVYAEGTVWTIRDTLSHLMTAERAFIKLFEQIRSGGPGVGEDFVIDRYNASQQQKTQDLTPGEILNSYRQARADMIAWLSGIVEPDLETTGRHPYLGPTTLREMIKMVYIHNQLHFRDVRRALKT